MPTVQKLIIQPLPQLHSSQKQPAVPRASIHSQSAPASILKSHPHHSTPGSVNSIAPPPHTLSSSIHSETVQSSSTYGSHASSATYSNCRISELEKVVIEQQQIIVALTQRIKKETLNAANALNLTEHTLSSDPLKLMSTSLVGESFDSLQANGPPHEVEMTPPLPPPITLLSKFDARVAASESSNHIAYGFIELFDQLVEMKLMEMGGVVGRSSDSHFEAKNAVNEFLEVLIPAGDVDTLMVASKVMETFVSVVFNSSTPTIRMSSQTQTECVQLTNEEFKTSILSISDQNDNEQVESIIADDLERHGPPKEDSNPSRSTANVRFNEVEADMEEWDRNNSEDLHSLAILSLGQAACKKAPANVTPRPTKTSAASLKDALSAVKIDLALIRNAQVEQDAIVEQMRETVHQLPPAQLDSRNNSKRLTKLKASTSPSFHSQRPHTTDSILPPIPLCASARTILESADASTSGQARPDTKVEQTNHELKEKLQAFMHLSERQIDALRKGMDRRTKLKQENSRLLQALHDLQSTTCSL